MDEQTYIHLEVADPQMMLVEGPPLLHNFVGRNEQLKYLNKIIEKHKIINIFGPMGTGKSFLVARFAEEFNLGSQYKVLWFSASMLGEDTQDFLWRYAILRAKDDREFLLWKLLNKEQITGTLCDLQTKLDIFFHDIISFDKLLFIIDNYPDGADNEFKQLIQQIAFQSNGPKLLLIGRRKTNMIKSSAHIQLGGLRKSELNAYIQKYCKGLCLDQEEINLLFEVTEGNPLVLLIAVNELNSTIKYSQTFKKIISSIYNMPGIQNLYYPLLKSLSNQERNLLCTLLSKPKPISKKMFYLMRFYYSKKLSVSAFESLIDKGILYQEANLYTISGLSRKYFSSIFNTLIN
jgi:hypothetical protein